MKYKSLKISSLLLVTCLLLGCTFATDDPGQTPGFLMGIWHGILAPYSLIASLFIEVKMYAVNNVGAGYDFGFLLGLIAAIPIGWLAAVISLLFYFFI